MNIETKAKIATLAAFEALEMMAKKANVEAKDIFECVISDPEGNTANYFNSLVRAAIEQVPAMLSKTEPK